MVATQVSQEKQALKSQTEVRLTSQERQITRNTQPISKVENKIDQMHNEMSNLASMMHMMMTGQAELKAIALEPGCSVQCVND